MESSSDLFRNEDGTSMVFCLRPCSIKAEVKKQILNGGGMCFSTLLKVPEDLRKDVIHLTPVGVGSSDRNALSANWIIDSVRKGKLLTTSNYRSKPITHALNEESIGRTPFTRKEDINILLYVRDNAGKHGSKLGGNAFWKKLEKLNMFQLRGRSWYSLRDRYLKKLKGNESDYPLEGRLIGPLPLPPNQLEHSHAPIHIDNPSENPGNDIGGNLPGSFLAKVEGRRNQMSPGLSQKQYAVLINDFVGTMEELTKLDSKSIHKVLFKCDGNEEIAKHFLQFGTCPEGYHMFDDEEDEILLKCLLNPTIADENPARMLAKEIGEDAVLRRAASLLGVSRADFNYMKSIPLKSVNARAETSSG